MRLAILSLLLALLAVCAVAIAPQKSVIVSYADNTPDHIVEQAKQGILDAVRLFAFDCVLWLT